MGCELRTHSLGIAGLQYKSWKLLFWGVFIFYIFISFSNKYATLFFSLYFFFFHIFSLLTQFSKEIFLSLLFRSMIKGCTHRRVLLIKSLVRFPELCCWMSLCIKKRNTREIKRWDRSVILAPSLQGVQNFFEKREGIYLSCRESRDQRQCFLVTSTLMHFNFHSKPFLVR